MTKPECRFKGNQTLIHTDNGGSWSGLRNGLAGRLVLALLLLLVLVFSFTGDDQLRERA